MPSLVQWSKLRPAPFVHDGTWALDLTAPLTVDHDRLVTPTLESNGPLWSLAYE